MDPRRRQPLALVFDDDRAAAEAMREQLAGLDYEVQVADDIVEARRFLEQMSVVVIVIDLGQATERGRHLLEDLASHPQAPPILVVAADEQARLTAADFSIACIERGCDSDALGAALTLTRTYDLRPLRRERGISVRRQAVLQAMIDAAGSTRGKDR